jgi:hypothetical protein
MADAERTHNPETEASSAFPELVHIVDKVTPLVTEAVLKALNSGREVSPLAKRGTGKLNWDALTFWLAWLLLVVSILLTVLAGLYPKGRWTSPSFLVWALPATIFLSLLAFSARFLRWSKKTDNPDQPGTPPIAERRKIELQFLQGIGVLLAVLTVLITYAKSESESFAKAKPLFAFKDEPGTKPKSFTLKNDGGWMMFLGVAPSWYRRAGDSSQLQHCKGLIKTPWRYQVLWKEATAVFELSESPRESCHFHFLWSDQNLSTYDMKFTVQKEAPAFDIGLPEYKRNTPSLLAAFAEAFHLAEAQHDDIPDRDPDTLCVSADAEVGCKKTDKDCPCSGQNAGH